MYQQLRQLALSQQKLTCSPSTFVGVAGTLEMIAHLGYVQIDTISVVERAHHHVLWNRVQNYQQDHLNILVKEQQIFEYWVHAAAYLPMRDYRFALLQMNAVRRGESRYFSRGDASLMREIMAQVRAEGRLRLRDLEQRHRTGSGEWWKASAGRRALEQLFMQGDLMICERQGMEKIYDLAERCLPAGINLTEPNIQQYAQYLFDQTLAAHGVFSLKQALHLKTGKPIQHAMRQIIDQQLECGRIERRQLDHGQYVYVDSHTFVEIGQAEKQLKILSPFDNVLIHRERLQHIFAMDYRLECYLPADQRRFGYFCLPILYGDQIVGRIDCKAYRAEKCLHVLSLHMENTIIEDKAEFYSMLMQELRKFSVFNQCDEIDVTAIQVLKNIS